jgi:hypothetical protein
MIVCPACRHVNDEEARVCARCGGSLEPGPIALMPPRRAEGPSPILEIPKPQPPSPWRAVAIVAALVGLLAGAGAYWLLRPDPCEGTNFASPAFGYCLTVPEGWTAEPARVGQDVVLDQFAPPRDAATVIVDATDLQRGATLEGWATFVRDRDVEAGLTPGPATETTVGGEPARQWDLTATSDAGTSYRMREVVVVRDEVGWRISLSDTADGFEVSQAAFRRMLDSFRFR